MKPGDLVEIGKLKSVLNTKLTPPVPGRYVVDRVTADRSFVWLRGAQGCVVATAVKLVEG